MALKPMNCPAHILIFRQGIKSYRDLPIRLAEFGCCHRNEPHGALHGIMRVRQFTQDDAHIFCREDQIVEEIAAVLRPARHDLPDLGFADYAIKLALRPEKRFGSDEMWDRAEQDLRDAVAAAGRDGARIWLGGAAGRRRLLCAQARIPPDRRDRPDLAVRHAAARLRACPSGSTPSMSARTARSTAPVMLHRAILGTFERFIGILIEHHAGRFPLWLAPVQAVVATIVSDADDYAREVVAALAAAGLRVEADLRNEKINYKVREHSLAKVPYLLVVGKREAEERHGRAAPARRRRAPGGAGARRGGRAARGRGAAAGPARG